MAAGAGLVLMALQLPLFWASFQVAPASAEVEGLARQYMAIRIWSAPAAISIYAITGWLIAQERSRAVLVLQVWMNGLNILLDLWFVLGLGWGAGRHWGCGSAARPLPGWRGATGCRSLTGRAGNG